MIIRRRMLNRTRKLESRLQTLRFRRMLKEKWKRELMAKNERIQDDVGCHYVLEKFIAENEIEVTK